MTRTHLTLGLATLAALGLAAAPARAQFASRAFSGDADSGVSSANVYTHMMDLYSAGGETINGVQFTGDGDSPTRSGENFSLATSGLGEFPTNFSHDNLTGGVRNLVSNFYYVNNGTAATPATETLTLSGLTPGTTYTADFYNVGFGTPGGRVQTITDSTGHSTVYDENENGDGNGSLLSDTYTATSGSVTFTFDANDDVNGFHQYGFSNQVDGASSADQITVANPSFEDNPAPAYPGYGSISGWTGGSGLNNVNGPFANNGTIPDGNQVAFIQDAGSLSQTLSGLTVGHQYLLTFYDNTRAGYPDADLTATLGGQTVVAPTLVTPVGNNGDTSESYNFVSGTEYTATATTADLVFQNLGQPGLDTTLLLDDVHVYDVTPAPEPSQTAALGLGMLGLAGLGFKARKRTA